MNVFLVLLLSLYYSLEALVFLVTPKWLRFKQIDKDIVCITGGGSGLGRALGVHFARQGCRKVVLWDLNNEGLQESLQLVQKEGAKCWTYICDVSDRNKVYELARKVEEEVGQVSILVNNAGIVSGHKLLDIPDEKIVKTFNVNAISHFWTTKAFLPSMIAKNHGHLVSVTSLGGVGGIPRLTDYCASKFAAVGFEESLRMELKVEGHHGIHSTVVCPYMFTSGLFKGFNTGFLSETSPDKLAAQVLNAVRINQEVFYFPNVFYFLTVLRALLPVKLTWLVAHDLFGFSRAMETFEGRNSHKKSN